jgi:Ca2+-binding EF-hand superfamily protein
MFEQADANGDGKVTKEEFVAAAVERAERMFGHLDADESGDVTKEEIKAARERFEGHGQRGGGPGGRFGRPGGAERPSGA